MLLSTLASACSKASGGCPSRSIVLKSVSRATFIWRHPEAFGLDRIECQQVRLLLALVCDRKGVAVTLRHVVMTPSDRGEEPASYSLIEPAILPAKGYVCG